MALETAYSFQLITPLINRASVYKEPKRIPASFSSTPSSSSSLSFPYPRQSTRHPFTFACRATDIFDKVTEVTDESWEELVLGSKIPALVEFWAPSCGPCKIMAPLLDDLAKEYAGKIACYKINTDDSLKMASKYGIRSIPTLLLLKNGEKLESITGAVKKNALSATIDKHL